VQIPNGRAEALIVFLGLLFSEANQPYIERVVITPTAGKRIVHQKLAIEFNILCSIFGTIIY
jgi:hypothetical protein